MIGKATKTQFLDNLLLCFPRFRYFETKSMFSSKFFTPPINNALCSGDDEHQRKCFFCSSNYTLLTRMNGRVASKVVIMFSLLLVAPFIFSVFTFTKLVVISWPRYCSGKCEGECAKWLKEKVNQEVWRYFDHYKKSCRKKADAILQLVTPTKCNCSHSELWFSYSFYLLLMRSFVIRWKLSIALSAIS